MKIVLRSIIVLVLALVAGLIWGYMEYQDLRGELSEVKEELKTETQKSLSYKSELDKTIADKLKVEKDLEELKQEHDKLMQEKANLVTEKEKLSQEKEQLSKEKASLVNENNSLKNEVANLKKR